MSMHVVNISDSTVTTGYEKNHPQNCFFMEWWDQEIIDHPDLVSNLVEHPVPLKGITDKAPKDSKPVEAILTPAERNRIRKLKRQEKVKEMQDMVRMGLVAPAPPRVKIKNMMLVLGQEAIAGPSAVEQAVRAQVDQRLRDHEERNEARKLDPESRRQKNIAKWTKPTETSQKLSVSIFLIFNKIHNKIKFKICKNAEQLHLGGIFAHSYIRDRSSSSFYPSLVVVEGSKKAVKKFDRLMLHRINWLEKLQDASNEEENTQMKDEDASDEIQYDDEDDGKEREAGGGVCKRIFHGSDAAKKFTRWNYELVKDLDSVFRFLDERNARQFWSMVERYRDTKLDI